MKLTNKARKHRIARSIMAVEPLYDYRQGEDLSEQIGMFIQEHENELFKFKNTRSFNRKKYRDDEDLAMGIEVIPSGKSVSAPGLPEGTHESNNLIVSVAGIAEDSWRDVKFYGKGTVEIKGGKLRVLSVDLPDWDVD